MRISGFTIVRNIEKFHYPVLESIQSILPICDEFVVNVGDSLDGTLDLILSLKDPRIRIVTNTWDMSLGKEVLSQQTNLALAECRGNWAFYLQSDEVIHEADLPRLIRLMEQYEKDDRVDALRFRWLHFYGSYHRYRIDYGWFQKQDRIIRNNKMIQSEGDAWGFQRVDGRPMNRINSGCLLYHYGWVHSPEVMTQRRLNAEQLGFAVLNQEERGGAYAFGDLSRFPPYFGSHPKVMQERIVGHSPTQLDKADINRKYWWHPMKIMGRRYKTFGRMKAPVA
jgi:hypothetical protein